MKKTGLLHDAIREKWLGVGDFKMLEGEIAETSRVEYDFKEIEREIAETLRMEHDCTRGINAAKLRSKEPHPADIEFAATSREKSIELVKEYAEMAMRHDKSKLATLATVVENRKAKIEQSSMPALIIGKLLMDFLEANDRLPHSRSELRKSAKAEYKAMIDASKTGWTKLCSRGLKHYKLDELIQDKRGRKSN